VPTAPAEIMVTLTIVDRDSLLDIRQQPRRFLPLSEAACIAETLRRTSAHNAYATTLATALDNAVSDAQALTGHR
jgi:hypothetical protein